MLLLRSDFQPLFINGQARCSMEETRFEPGSAGYEAAELPFVLSWLKHVRFKIQMSIHENEGCVITIKKNRKKVKSKCLKFGHLVFECLLYLDEFPCRHDSHRSRLEPVLFEHVFRNLFLSDNDGHGVIDSRQHRFQLIAA